MFMLCDARALFNCKMFLILLEIDLKIIGSSFALISVLACQSSGSPPSTFQIPYDSFKEQTGPRETDYSNDGRISEDMLEPNPKDLDYEFICFFLSSNRLDLYRSIDIRCEDMLSGSLSWQLQY